MAARVSYLWVHPTFRGATCDQIGCTCFGNEPLKEMENLIHQEKQQVSTNKISDLNKKPKQKKHDHVTFLGFLRKLVCMCGCGCGDLATLGPTKPGVPGCQGTRTQA